MYSFRVDIKDGLTRAKLTSDDGEVLKSRAWLDKDVPNTEEGFGELLREIVDALFPKKIAPEKPETKTIRGKSK